MYYRIAWILGKVLSNFFFFWHCVSHYFYISYSLYFNFSFGFLSYPFISKGMPNYLSFILFNRLPLRFLPKIAKKSFTNIFFQFLLNNKQGIHSLITLGPYRFMNHHPLTINQFILNGIDSSVNATKYCSGYSSMVRFQFSTICMICS